MVLCDKRAELSQTGRDFIKDRAIRCREDVLIETGDAQSGVRQIDPPSAGTSPEITLSRLDLPVPLRPMNRSARPPRCRLASSKSGRWPNEGRRDQGE
jgi:hypothetical protein